MTQHYKNSTSLDDATLRLLNSKDDIKTFLDISLESYIEDGNFNVFYRALETAIRASDNISEFSKKTNLNRSNLYKIFKNKSTPKFDTVAKILEELGFSLKIA